ncbi:hypothetical protein M011DRAFT_82299 [Sporormia fimetaria CBS 119925]|uniref:Zn(2)-C6 fungal-type domain-containing protein n=1 Tax=Sporormia fimetaria CBS 119925 TaxID=1340428 RepID=A0A6A6V8Q8_9PLEO|nr:hypothetical protein M011DRAFT_82299 [Sporormia fimetaria CBS 119925]
MAESLSAQTEGSTGEKLHTACDECRTRKLKCSGDWPLCARCRREQIQCVYSPQKQMGRPKKRRREEPTLTPTHIPDVPQLHQPAHWDPAIHEDNDTFALPADYALLNFTTTDDFMLPPYSGSPQYPLSLHTNQADCSEVTISSSTAVSAAPINGASQTETPCTCLSLVFLATSELQAMSVKFPAALRPLRDAMRTALSILKCENCPKQFLSAMQNTQSLLGLLMAIAERFHRILKNIDAETDELDRTGEKKLFRLGDHNPSVQHLHTQTLDCPMGFDILLDGTEWKTLAKKALRAEVIGGGTGVVTLIALLDQFEQRQEIYHSSHVEERVSMFGNDNCCNTGDHNCVRGINQVRGMIANMQWK